MKIYSIALCAALSFLAACNGGGGGGGGGNNPPPDTTPATYTIGGIVSGLSGTLVLQNNGGDDLELTSDNSFTFATAVASTYSVTVKDQPSGQSCSIANGSGSVSGADITNVLVTCVTSTGQAVSPVVHRLAIGGGKYTPDERYTLAIKADGSVLAWGNMQGGAGPAISGAVASAHSVSGLSNIASVAISAGDEPELSYAVDTSGNIFAWGTPPENGAPSGFSEWTWGTILNSPTKADLFGPVNSFEENLSVLADGSVWGIETLRSGLSNSTIVSTFTAAQIPGIADVADLHNGYAIKRDGTVWQINIGAPDIQYDSSTGSSLSTMHYSIAQVAGLSNITQIICSSSATGLVRHCLALDGNGEVYAWGGNSYGQLGDGTTQNSETPLKVAGVSSIQQVAAAGGVSFALTTSGQVYVWGGAGGGQNAILGLGASVYQVKSPTLMPSLSKISEITSSKNSDSVLVRDSDGFVWGWGENGAGQLGDGTTNAQYVPVQVLGINLN